MGEKYKAQQVHPDSEEWCVWVGDSYMKQDCKFDAECLAEICNRAHAAGLATAQAELDTLRNEIASLTRLDWTGTLCDRLNMIARRHGWNPCRNGEEGAALAVVVDSYCASAEAELTALREALVGVIKEADRETDAFIFARKVLARSETAP